MAQSACGVRQFNGKQSLPEKSQFLSTGDLEIPQDIAILIPRHRSSALLPSVPSSSKLVNNGSKSSSEFKSDKVESLNSLPVIKSPLPDFRRCQSSDKGFIPTVRSLSTSGYNDSFLGAMSALSRSSVSLSSSPMSMSLGGSPLTPHIPLKPSNLSRIGPGGLPQSRESRERTYYRPRENEILDMANIMGMTPSRGSKRESVRISSPRRSFQLSSLSTIGRNSQAATSVNSVNNSSSSQKGVRLSEILRFAESLHDEDITTFNVAKKMISALTSKQQCRYVDTLDEDHLRSPPDAYIIHNSRQPFYTLMAHMKQYFELQGLSINQVFVWIDIFCVNLHRDTPTGSADLVLTNELIASSRKVLLFLDSEGVAFSRTWVLYEAWQASLSERHDKLVVVPTSWAWQDLVFPYIAMDITSSDAWQDVDRLLMLREFQKAVETSSVAKIKEAMLLGTKRELQRTDVTVTGGQPLRMVYTGTAYGLLLFLEGRYTEAEEVLSGLQHKMEKFGGLNNGDDTEMLFHLALIAREKGSRNKSEAYLLACIRDSRSEGVREDLYLEAMLMYAQCLYDNEQYTKGELLCRKLLEMTDQYSDMLTEKARLKFRARGRVQLSALSLGQKLVKEAEERAEETLRDVHHNKEASTELLAASCYKILSECAKKGKYPADMAEELLRKALFIRTDVLGVRHPDTLELKCVEAKMLTEDERLEEAEPILLDVYRTRLQLLGPNHIMSIRALMSLADHQRQMHKWKEAEGTEDRLLSVGTVLLKHCKPDFMNNFNIIMEYLHSRDHLIKKATTFITKAYIMFKKMFGKEAEVTKNSMRILGEMLDKEREQATEALGEAEISGNKEKYQTAELFFRLAVTVSKHLFPNDTRHVTLIQGWANALCGLGRDDDAKDILRAAGLARKTMQQAMPLTYQRWMKPRVAKYMDSRAEKEDQIRAAITNVNLHQ